MAATYQIDLRWDPNSESDLAGYKIYWGTSTGSYSRSKDVGLPSLVGGLVPGQLLSEQSEILGTIGYFIAVTAYDTSDNESDFSNEVNTTAKAVELVTDFAVF